MIAIAAMWLHLIVAAPAALAAPSSSVHELPRGQVRGQVIDAGTRAPIPGAQVTIVELTRSVLTDAA